ncbi:anaerobic ribonucleoside-triphosphate reductase [Chitinolyticbacter meiyuanensis]|uniref:anaerobic ribonucleoside-triphosphate reductase n=1 Tax=Chitinolyticbacter meiyuanensis TaxID=682798 RepID=UPI0011E5D0F0|nr:anaerobic ribonucleoside-triphosphate reductase [Chitinolyticbacter meiyuanensis]
MTDLAEQRHLASDAQTTSALPDEQRTRCEVWTRVMGYHRPVSAFNTGKQGEFAERTFFRER